MISLVVLTRNRLESLKRCLNAIFDGTTTKDYEVIVIDNGSTDDTCAYLSNLKSDKIGCIIINAKNEGVIARNTGFKIARGNITVQIDDDAYVDKGWDTRLLEPFSDPKVGLVGVQGGLVPSWLTHDVYSSNNGFVDFVTGFCFAMRNVGILYDNKFGGFWFEDSDLCFQFKSAGYKLKTVSGGICCHASKRTEIDWDLHNSNLEYITNKWKDRLPELRLGGN